MSISIPRWQIGSLCRLKRESKFQVSGHEHGCSKVVNHLGDEVMKVFSGMKITQRLNSIAVRGYRSIEDVQLELRPLNVLIGANGADKSN